MKRVVLILTAAAVPGFSAGAWSSKPAPRSGCCSHHGGVCGCAGSSARCCDGNLSPSYDCN